MGYRARHHHGSPVLMRFHDLTPHQYDEVAANARAGRHHPDEAIARLAHAWAVERTAASHGQLVLEPVASALFALVTAADAKWLGSFRILRDGPLAKRLIRLGGPSAAQPV
jgi:hypothetical protein